MARPDSSGWYLEKRALQPPTLFFLPLLPWALSVTAGSPDWAEPLSVDSPAALLDGTSRGFSGFPCREPHQWVLAAASGTWQHGQHGQQGRRVVPRSGLAAGT